MAGGSIKVFQHSPDPLCFLSGSTRLPSVLPVIAGFYISSLAAKVFSTGRFYVCDLQRQLNANKRDFYSVARDAF